MENSRSSPGRLAGWLQDPEYVSVHAEAAAPTPLKLQQAYMVCPLQDKVDILWSFIKTHLKVGAGAQQASLGCVLFAVGTKGRL